MEICSHLASFAGSTILTFTLQTSQLVACWQVNMKMLIICLTLHKMIVQWYILLRWPEGHVFSGEPLKLCFEDEEEAECWRDALVTAVSGDCAHQEHTAESHCGHVCPPSFPILTWAFAQSRVS